MEDNKLTKEELIEHVKKAINPSFQNWILFKNGTYIIIEDTSDEKEIEKKGLEIMKQYGPVSGGGPPGDFSIITLSQTEGWVVSSHGPGMYTYVHPAELGKEDPKDIEVGLFGRGKRDMDGENPEIVGISSKGQIIEK